MRLFVDGAVALCIETVQVDGERAEHWYGLLLLTSALEDERVLRQRLERVFCWRESPERWARYRHMLPVLILAHSSRQRDHWQQAMTHAAHQLRVEPLAGASACIADRDGESQMDNPWLFNWRMLSTGHLPPLRPAAARPGDGAPSSAAC